MDWGTFVIRLIEALAWPIAATMMLLAFRKEVRSLMPLLRKIKAGPLEAEFEREVLEISLESAGQSQAALTVETPRQEMLRTLADVNPKSAILEAWLGVESAVRRATLQRIGGSPPPDVSSPVRAMRDLMQSEIISPDDGALFHDLRGLRNQAAHLEDFSPTKDAALHYVDLASRLEARLEELAALRQ